MKTGGRSRATTVTAERKLHDSRGPGERRKRCAFWTALALAAAFGALVAPAAQAAEQKLTASGGAAGDQFGQSVAIDGDTMIVGARVSDVGGNGNEGSAYVFVRSGGVWTQQQQLTANDPATGDEFGFSVAISGNTVVVGALGDDVGANADQGSAYVFVRSGGVWTQQQKLTASDGAASDSFGYSVSVGGDTLVVGAAADDVGANADWDQAPPTSSSEAAASGRNNRS